MNHEILGVNADMLDREFLEKMAREQTECGLLELAQETMKLAEQNSDNEWPGFDIDPYTYEQTMIMRDTLEGYEPAYPLPPAKEPELDEATKLALYIWTE